MTETIFKKGDTVEVVNLYGGTSDNRVGAKGTITEVRAGGTAYNVQVENEDNARFGHNLVFYPSELKLVKPTPKFQVGDWVKVKGRDDEWDGSVCVITESLRGSGNFGRLYAVNIESGTETGPAHFFECDLEATDAPKPAPLVKDIDVAALTIAKNEAVKHPAHYGGGDNPYEAIKVIEAWGLGFNLGNAAKYLARAGKKGNKVEDLNKLIQYVQFEIAKEEAK